MKSRLTFCLLSLLLCSLFSCTKETSNEKGGPTTSGGDFYATVNDKLWNADSLELILVTTEGVSINGLSKTGEQISMVLPEFKVGSYTLNGTSLSYALYANLLDDVSNVFVSNTGQAGGIVTITSIDSVNHLVSGSFHFNLTNPADNTTKTITDGVFDHIPFTGSSGGIQPPTGGGLDTLTALTGGTPFKAATVQENIVAPGPGEPDQLVISGISADVNQAISLIMPASVGAGTYNLDYETGKYIGIYYPDLMASPPRILASVSNGTLTILSNDTMNKRIKGTFSFTATPFDPDTPVEITQGYFAVSY